MENPGEAKLPGGPRLRSPLLASHSGQELISLLPHLPSPAWGNSHYPKAERTPEGGDCLARNDCPSVNNLLLPRGLGSEARMVHNGLWS